MLVDQEVLVEDADGILVITLNRPAVRNAIDRATSVEVARVLDEFEARADLLVAVLAGAGVAFSAGADLKAVARGESPLLSGRGLGGITERPPEKPIIAAVEGFAFGGGLEMALACDLLVAARGARLGIPEVRRGMMAASGGLIRLSTRAPRNVAMELALTGQPISAERAYELGLVNRLTDPGQALAEAREMAAAIRDNSPRAVRASKHVVREMSNIPEAQAFQLQRPLAATVAASADAREGAQAFAEGRAPRWQQVAE